MYDRRKHEAEKPHIHMIPGETPPRFYTCKTNIVHYVARKSYLLIRVLRFVPPGI
jgi:hypothetical protein